MAEIARRNSRRYLFTLFPDKGPLARHLYQKQLEFFRAGKHYRERCFMAGNRCISPWTWVETPAGSVLSAELWTSRDARVLSWDGESECVSPIEGGLFLGIEPAFRVVLDNGLFFDCSRMHRVLTSEGWLSLDQLVSLSSGLRLWHRVSDYQASCDMGGYLGDRALQSIGGISLKSPPSIGGVRGRAPLIYEHSDEVEQELQYIRACQQPDHLSTPEHLRRFVGLFSLFAGPSSDKPVLSLNADNLAVQRLALELGQHLQSDAEFARDQSVSQALEDLLILSLGAPYNQLLRDAKDLVSAQLCDAQFPGESTQGFVRGAEHMAIFYPWDHPKLVGDRRIVAIVQLGLMPIIDAHVPIVNNYKAGGVYHHNTGKTIAAGYELTLHLTGLYPHWWEGRRFSRPVKAWAAGKSNESTRDILQRKLLGQITGAGTNNKNVDGTGLIPGDHLGRPNWKQSVADFVDTIPVLHKPAGGWSTLGFKSYAQGAGSYEGTEQQIILLDEEPPMDVYGECLIRTAGNIAVPDSSGIMMLSFTPKMGLSDVVLSFMPEESRPGFGDEVRTELG